MDYVLDCGFLRFRLQLHVETLQLDNLVYNNCMWHYYGGTRFERLPPIFFRLQVRVAARFFPKGCPGSRGDRPESSSGKTDSKGPLIGLENHLMDGVKGVLLNPSGKCGSYFEAYIYCGVWHSGAGFGDGVCPRNHALPCKFSSVIQNAPYGLLCLGYSILASIVEFAGDAVIQWAGYRPFSSGHFLLVWASSRE